MSTLQISLAVAGGLVLAGVVAHTAWSARKNEPKRPTPEPLGTDGTTPAAAPDMSFAQPGGGTSDTERKEPGFDDLGPAFGAGGDSGLASLQAMMAPEKKPGLDALIDVIAPVATDSPVSGEAALAALPATRRAGSKPFAIEGLNTLTDQWELPAPHQRYSAFQCGVQLANRLGGLNQIEYSEFVMKAQAFADAIGGEPEFPEMLDEVARARELDQFASAHDAQLSFTLRAVNTAWSPGYVQQSAARIGFVSSSVPGRMVLPSEQPGGAPMLGLSFDSQAAMAEDPEQTALREVTLSLDVPQVLRTDQPFGRMCESALALARSMEGIIVDDDGNRIRAEAMDLIATELEQLYDRLDERDLSAGSVAARRLFS
ncbi:MAG: cell division protein FtsZ [Polaromonas sp.]|nr:cell division protein FtsZ [Polaromonas sp.]